MTVGRIGRRVGMASVVLALAMLCGVARADSWVVTGADFSSQTIALKGLDGEGVKGEAGGRAVAVPVGGLLSLSRVEKGEQGVGAEGANAGTGFYLHLLSGDVIAGAPAEMGNEVLTWKSGVVGEAKVPVRYLAWMGRAGVSVAEGKRGEDVVVLKNGDAMKGVVTGMSGKDVTIQGEGGGDATPVGLDAVSAVEFATPHDAAAVSSERGWRVKLSDGSVLTAASITGDENKWTITLPGAPARELEGSAVVGIEQVNGPVSFLSSRAPSEVVQIPYLGAAWPTRMDRSVTGGPIRFEGRTFGHGIGVHAYSKISWPLDGTYKAFRTQYAIDGEGAYADVDVRILVDGKVVHEAKDVRAGVLSGVVTVPVSGGKVLTLEVDYGANHDTQDRFEWIEAALVR